MFLDGISVEFSSFFVLEKTRSARFKIFLFSPHFPLSFITKCTPDYVHLHQNPSFRPMNERLLILEQADPAVLFGINNCNILLIKALYPKLRIGVRGNAIKILGENSEMDAFEKALSVMEKYCVDFNDLNEETIRDIAKGKAPLEVKQDNLIVHGMSGKSILARTENQQKLVEAYFQHDMIFAIGPAGSGKTYTAIALAVRALKNREVKKIILCRPAVEAGEKLGFLPGDMKEKIDPYLQPLYDALEDMIPPAKLKDYMDNKIIQIAPLAFMRGRTLSDAVIILDEAQNTTTQQIKMFLTRLGMNAKMIITGDITQIDLPPTATSGLIQALNILRHTKGIAKIEFNKKDIVRHKLVTRIVEAYEKHSEEQQAKRVLKKDDLPSESLEKPVFAKPSPVTEVEL
jgi:phosphate starvation-inducible protein PhoH and related proteins